MAFALLLCGLAVAQVNPGALLDQAGDDSLSLAEKQELLDRIFQNLTPEVPPEVVAGAHLLQAQVYLGTGELERAIATLDQALARLPRSESPDYWVRLKSSQATMLLAAGDPEAAVSAHEDLLAGDNSDVSLGEMIKVRVNFATALHEAGRVLEASGVYYEVIPQALQLGDTRTALIIGNNLVVVLMSRRLYEDARSWLIRLKPMREESSYATLVNSLRLHEWELQRILGDPEGAAAQIQDFLDTTDEENVALLGNAHEKLADALHDAGDLKGSEQAARSAVKYLQSVRYELADAQLGLVRTLLASGQYAAAREELARVEVPAGAPASRRSNLSALELEVALREQGLNPVADELKQLVASMQEENRQNSVEYVRYYDAKLLAEQQQSEIQRIKASETRLALEARDATERSRQLEQRQITLRHNRNLTVAVIVLSAGAALMVLYLVIRRAYQRQLLAREQEQNRQLSALVEEKSAALSQQLKEQAAMQQALDRKKQAELIGQLTGNVAHDFNNLLQVISNVNDLVADEARSPDSRLMLKASNDSIQYARAMTHQLLAYARQQELHARPVDVLQLLGENHTLLRSAAGEAITLTVHKTQQPTIALVDPAQLNTGMLNLIRNAADAMPTGGRVDITVAPLSKKKAADWPLEPGEYLVITVTDNGEGMSPEELEKACEPYFTTKSEGRGTGLGLSSVFGFARQSGGDLKIQSTLGSGTEVRLALPAASALEQPTLPTQEELPLAALDGQKILVVEDNALVARTVNTILSNAGAQVSLVDSADDARDRLRESAADFDLLLTDIRMPGQIDGYALAEWATENCPELKVLLMSGFNEPVDKPLHLPLISKPFTREQLVAALAEA